MLVQNHKLTLAATLLVTVLSPAAIAQVAQPAIIELTIQNVVQYIDDISDPAVEATVQTPTTGAAPLNFRKFVILGDITAVNGKPAKGTLVENSRAITMRPTTTPGQAIADINRNNLTEFGFEILTLDGDTIGSVVGISMGNGPPPPGAPQRITQGNNSIMGGTGAYLGARGQMGQNTAAVGTSTQRVASMSEDPANRRILGGATQTYILHIIPMTRPEVASVFHADLSAVTAAKPAKAGELLILKASGLGPTRPGIEPGQAFPADALQPASSPVDVTVNGTAAGVINAIGWPGLVDTYRVDFKVPDGTAAGSASLQLSSAWIPGTPVSFPVQ